MNHRYRPAPRIRLQPPRSITAILVFVAALSVCASGARAQRALPADLKGAADVKPRIGEIQKFVATQVALLVTAPTPDAQQKARNALANETSGGGAAFLEAYATTVNDQLLPLAKSPSTRTRLLAAITLCRVANGIAGTVKAGQTSPAPGHLADAAAAFAQDDGVGVALWGIRGAQPIIQSLAAAGTQTKLTGAVVAGVKKHPTSGDLVDDAYRALALNYKTEFFNNVSVAVVLKDLLAMYSFRVGQYVTTTPPKPELDAKGTNFPTLSRVWDAPASQALRGEIIQQMVNLIGAAAQHAGAREGADRRPFVDVMKNAGSALAQLGSRPDVNDNGIKAAGAALQKVTNSLAPEEFTNLATAAQQAVSVKFPTVKPYPQIQPDATAAPTEPEIPDTTADDLVNNGGGTTRPSKAGESTDTGAGGPTTAKSAPMPAAAPHAPATSGKTATPPAPPKPATPAPAPTPGKK